MDNGELGRKLYDIRRQRGLSMRQLSGRSPDLTSTTISRVETGVRWPNLKTLQALVTVLEIVVTISPDGIIRIEKL